VSLERIFIETIFRQMTRSLLIHAKLLSCKIVHQGINLFLCLGIEPFSLLWPSVEFPVCEDCSRRFDDLVVVGGRIVLALGTVN
jgi:hypothetical protein